MQSQKDKVLTRGIQIINENPTLFKALEDFEKTGKLILKTRLNFTIDRDTAKKFRDYCKKNRLNMSEIVEELIEKKSAKVPGREIFNKMLDRIEKGHANGIISWHPDRLARNSVDGGRVIYLLDTGKLSALKFNTFWFEPTPQGKFMLSIAFSQSKYYVDSLSENTKRGLRQKAKNGYCPNMAPFGYINDVRTKTVVVNKRVAPFITQAFELYSKDESTIGDIIEFFTKNGITNPEKKKFRIDKIRKIFKNPYYYGVFRYAGEIIEGRHDPIISKLLFDKVQEVLNSRNHQWQEAKTDRIEKPFLGLLKCGECGMMITGEIATKRYKNGTSTKFRYYRCTRKSKTHRCLQPFIREEDLDNQLTTLIINAPQKADQKPTTKNP